MVLIKDTGRYSHRGKWLLLSSNKKQVLRVFPRQPTEEAVIKEEKRIQYFKNLKGRKSFSHVKQHNRSGKPVSAHYRKVR